MTVILCAILVGLLSRCGGGSSQQPLQRLTIAPAALPNGTSETPYSQTIQASGGVAPFNWTVSAGALPHNVALSGGATNTVTISGTPDTAAQGVAFTIQVTDSASQSASQSYTVSILLEPDTLTLAPPSVDFVPQLIGTPSRAQSETVTNTGTAAVVISSIAITGTNAANFGQSNTCESSIGAGANCTISITFTPNLPGPHGASITITDNTMGSPHSVSLSGTGLTSGSNATLSATSMAFGNQTLDTTSSAQSVTLSNYGTTTLNIASIAASTNFGETMTCNPTLVSGANCTIDVTFTPSNTGNLNGTLSVADSAGDSPQIVSLSGTGVAGQCSPEGHPCDHARCCPGLVCIFRGGSTRAGYACEPKGSENISRANSFWDRVNANKLE